MNTGEPSPLRGGRALAITGKGELLEAVREAQVQGEVRTRKEALTYVEQVLQKE